MYNLLSILQNLFLMIYVLKNRLKNKKNEIVFFISFKYLHHFTSILEILYLKNIRFFMFILFLVKPEISIKIKFINQKNIKYSKSVFYKF